MKPIKLRAAALPVLERPPVYWREAMLCTPAMPLLLLAGIATGNVAYGAVAAGAAFSVGFGAAREFRGWRWAAMILATLGTAAFAVIGSLAGRSMAAEMMVAGAAAAGCAAFALIDEDVWWITLQMVIALLVAGYYPGDLNEALRRGMVVFAGGATQVVIVALLALLAPKAAQPLPRAAAPKLDTSRKLLVSHAIRAAVCVVLALGCARLLGLANSYWAPMTAMLVLKPGLSETHVRGFARLGGTFAGCVAASAFALAIGYYQPLLLAGVALTAYAAFSLQKAHYAVLSSAITATVVLLLSLAHGGGVLLNAEHRLIATLVGGAIALVIARVAPHKPLLQHPGADAVGRSAAGA